MKLRNWLLSVSVLCCTALIVGQTFGEDKKDEKKPAEAKKDAPPAGGEKKPEAPKDARATGGEKKPEGGAPAMSAEEAKAMEAWMKAMMPGPEHEVLKKLSGSWTYALKHRMDPNMPWGENAGTIERKMIMGGRIMQEDVKGPSVIPGAPPFEGIGLSGYDNVQKKYWGTWNDNMGTGIMNMVGTADASGKVITYSAEYWDPMSGKLKKQKHVCTLKDDKTNVLQMFDTDKDGKEFLSFDMTCTKK